MAKNGQSKNSRKTSGRPKRQPNHKANPRPSREELLKEIAMIVGDLEGWLNSRNTAFYGQKPIDLLGTEDEHLLYEWLGRIKYGIFV